MEKICKLVYILKKYSKIECYELCVFDGEYKFYNIDRGMNDEIVKGTFFIGDFIKLEINNDKAEFSLLKEEDENEDKNAKRLKKSSENGEKENIESVFDKNESKKYYELEFLIEKHCTRLLNSILPFSGKNELTEIKGEIVIAHDTPTGKYLVNGNEVKELTPNSSKPFIARIMQKTRIFLNTPLFNPFFYVIASSNNNFIKIVFWKETLEKYSALKAGDVVLVEDYRRRKKGRAHDQITYNNISESAYFNCPEITAKSVSKVDLDGLPKLTPIFHTVEGFLNYQSVILKYKTPREGYFEYCLCRVGDKNVMLFYNSSDEFYNIRDKKIKVTELRKVDREGFVFYVNTIYTQIEICEDAGAKSKTLWGAVGFIPDKYASLDALINSEHKEIILGKSFPSNNFFEPQFTRIEFLNNLPLVLNEVKKFYFEGTVEKITKCPMSTAYSMKGKTGKQEYYKVLLKEGIRIYYTHNFFTGEISTKTKIKADCKAQIQELEEKILNKKMILFVDAFRFSNSRVLIFLTGFMDYNK